MWSVSYIVHHNIITYLYTAYIAAVTTRLCRYRYNNMYAVRRVYSGQDEIINADEPIARTGSMLRWDYNIIIIIYLRDIVIYFGIILFSLSRPPTACIIHSITSNLPTLYRYYRLFFFSARSLCIICNYILCTPPRLSGSSVFPSYSSTRGYPGHRRRLHVILLLLCSFRHDFIRIYFVFFSSAFLVLRPTMITRASYLIYLYT